jgi:AcrR family transcriptional regulator
MARRAARTKPINSELQKGRKETQRERILDGIVAAANRDGYAGANVTEVIAQAGVSRPTFYDYFADRDDCFLAAIADAQRRLTDRVRRAVEREPPERAVAAAIVAIVAFASEQPARAHFLMGESLAGGPAALDARDAGVGELQAIIERADSRVAPTAEIPDIAPQALIGGVYRLLAPRLRRGEPSVATLAADLVRWSESYAEPANAQRWRKLKETSPPALSPPVAIAPLRKPERLPPGRQGLSSEEVAANHRQRILFAAAELAESKGYGATTIADITKRAGIDGRNFYALFVDKQDAFMSLHELGLQQVLSVTASAFFSGASWPERIWAAVRAFAQFLQGEPLITHVGFVEAHAVGPGASQRVHDSHTAFAIFLQEGYLHLDDERPPTPAMLEAIVTTLFEIVYQQTRAGSKPKLAGLTPQMTFLCLAPFLGAAQSSRFIEAKLSAGRPTSSRRARGAPKPRSRPKRPKG